MTGLQTTYYSSVSTRADFNANDFSILIQQKGREVVLEKALICSCKDAQGNAQSNCRNCLGAGWLFINPTQTRMILQNMTATVEYLPNGEAVRGDLKVSALDTEELSFMDRITDINSDAIYSQVLFFRTKGTGSNAVTFAFAAYNIKDILYIGYFTGTNTAFQKLVYNTDYTFNKNIVTLINPALVAVQSEISVTIRYKHAPAYHIIDMKRESMESFQFTGTDTLIHLPVAGTARRAHYIIDSNNLNGDKLINNSYAQSNVVAPPTQTPSFSNFNEIDPVWNSQKNNYYTKTQVDGLVTSEDQLTINAGETISSGNAVVVTGGSVFKFNPNNVAHLGELVGVANNGANTGNPVTIQIIGQYTNSAYSFDQSKPVFVDGNSNLTTTIPTDTIILQRIGSALGTNTLNIQIVAPIKRLL